MKKQYIPLFLSLFIIPLIVSAKSYNTIAIEGSNTGWAADETFANISHDGNTDPRHAYFTWDADYIYIGIMDDEADYNNMATFVYFDTDPSGTNGSTDAYAWGNNIITGFNADYVVVFKNQIDGSGTHHDYIEVMQYNNGTSAWDQIAFSDATYLYDGSDTLVKFAEVDNSNYREVKIKRSQIGNPEAIKTCMFTEQQWPNNYRYMTWPSEGWSDANRAAGQTIPNYYGFLLENNVSLDSVPYYNAAFTTWNGNSDNNWSNVANWDNGIPADTTLVIIPSGSTVTVDASGQSLFDLTIQTGGTVTVGENNSLTVNGGFFNIAGASGMEITSSSSGNGSLIVKGYDGDSVTAQCYVTASHWHSFAAPVSGQTTSDLFLNHSPEVWLLQYNEPTDDYTYVPSLTQDLGDMQGWMLWLGGSNNHTFTFAGPLHTGTLGSNNNMVRSSASTGYNFVGNPFTSAIDWDAANGWTKTNLNNAIYVYNHNGTTSHWATYIDGAGVNGGSRYIAMNQGFFVEVTDGGGSYPEYGTLQMNNAVCVHNTVQFFNNTQNYSVGKIIRLQVNQDSLTDETIIRVHPDATLAFDSQLDAHKLQSFAGNSIGIFSTGNNGMSINSVPPGTETIPIDFYGTNNTIMTVSVTEADNFDHVFLTDNFTGITVDLINEPYTFTYINYIHNRFFIHFTITNTDTNSVIPYVNIYATKNNINIVNRNNSAFIEIYNILGQKIISSSTKSGFKEIAVKGGCYYVVNVFNRNHSETRKVYVP